MKRQPIKQLRPGVFFDTKSGKTYDMTCMYEGGGAPGEADAALWQAFCQPHVAAGHSEECALHMGMRGTPCICGKGVA